MLTISDKASDKIRNLLEEKEQDPETWALRVGVEGGGCSGFQYQMDFVDASELKDGEQIFEHQGARVLIDSKSLLFVGGSEVDYLDGLTGAGFTIKNPQATGTCGCGQSFSV